MDFKLRLPPNLGDCRTNKSGGQQAVPHRLVQTFRIRKQRSGGWKSSFTLQLSSLRYCDRYRDNYLRCATAIAIGLLQLQSEIIGEFRRLPARQARIKERNANEATVCSGGPPPNLQSDLECGNERSEPAVSCIAGSNLYQTDNARLFNKR